MADISSIAKTASSSAAKEAGSKVASNVKNIEPSSANIAKSQGIGTENASNKEPVTAPKTPNGGDAPDIDDKKQYQKDKKGGLVNTAKDAAKLMANPDAMSEEEQIDTMKEVNRQVIAEGGSAALAATGIPAEVSKPVLDAAAQIINKTKAGEAIAKQGVKAVKLTRTLLIVGLIVGACGLIMGIALVISPIILISKTAGGELDFDNLDALNFGEGGSDINDIANPDYDIYEYDDEFSKKIDVNGEGTDYCDIVENCGTGSLTDSTKVASYATGGEYYTATGGESIEDIANQYGVSAEVIRDVNNLSGDILAEGQIIRIPLASYPLEVASGRTWEYYASTSRRYDMNGGQSCYRNGKLVSKTGCNHTGIDFNRNGITYGTPVYSLAKGTVVIADKTSTGYGFRIKIGYDVDKDGKYDYYSLYAHLSSFAVVKGQSVNAGQKIGEVGSTGNSTGAHLHFELRNKNDRVIDPAPYLNQIASGTSVFNTAGLGGKVIETEY